MAELVFEIWRDDAVGEQSVEPVSERGDRARFATMPNARLVHTFLAKSNFDAAQKSYDWSGWGVWRPEPDWIEQSFTDYEAAAQQAYIAQRNGS